ncbi:MAG: ammonia channel protein, partial [Firmicutes bacterium]|nr:ammonia channel protein [Bacillota bacterium]
GGGFMPLLKQCAGALISGVYFFVVSYVMVKLLMKFAGGRISPEMEDEGLDSAYHHENLYND